MFSSTKDLARWPLMLAALAMLASLATVHSAPFDSTISRELNFNSIPGGENDESNMVEPMPFSSFSDFLDSKQGLGKKTDDTTRMKALVKALYALDALDKKMADKSESDASDILMEDVENANRDSSTPATTTVGATGSTTVAATTTKVEPTTEVPATDTPTLVHDSEVNEFVEQIAKHISNFFQGILHYFDRPNLPPNTAVIIEIEEKIDDGSSASSGESSESGENDSDNESTEEISTEEVPKWLVQMFESVANLPREVAEQDKSREFRPREPLDADER